MYRELDMTGSAYVAPEKPFLADEMKVRGVVWTSINLRGKKSTWKSVLLIDGVQNAWWSRRVTSQCAPKRHSRGTTLSPAEEGPEGR